MQSKKLIISIVTLLIITMFLPFYCFANDDTSFVWSDISSPSVETVASLTEGKREFFKFNMWWCYFN